MNILARVTCDCGIVHDGFVCDALPSAADPTGTERLRRSLAFDLEQRWRRVMKMVEEAVAVKNFFGIGSDDANSIQVVASSGGKLMAFQTWMDATLESTVLSERQSLGAHVLRAYSKGLARAKRLWRVDGDGDLDNVDLLTASTYAELQGIAEAVSQRAVRAFARGLSSNLRPRIVTREIWDVVQSVGMQRTSLLAQFAVVKAHTEGNLDALDAGGIKTVGLQAETQRGKKLIGDGDKPGHPFHGNQYTTGTVSLEQPLSEDEQDELFNSMGSGLSPEERRAIDRYIGSDFSKINSALRSGKTSDPLIKHLDSAIKGSWVPRDVTLFRGVNKSVFDKLVSDGGATDKGYLSASLDSSVAKKFSGDGGGIVKMIARRGQNAVPAAGIGENEILLQRGLTMRVERVDHEKRVAEVSLSSSHADSIVLDAPKKQGFTKTFLKTALRRERRLSKIGSQVNVQTKEDDKVCPRCDEIAINGPYDLDTARGLIPAHPRCRCAFVPVEDDTEEDDE